MSCRSSAENLTERKSSNELPNQPGSESVLARTLAGHDRQADFLGIGLLDLVHLNFVKSLGLGDDELVELDHSLHLLIARLRNDSFLRPHAIMDELGRGAAPGDD